MPIFFNKLASTGASTGASLADSIKLNDTEQGILQLCAEAPIGRSDIVKALGHKSLSGSIKQALANLKTAVLIALTIPEKPNSKNQQYRITELGKALLKQKNEFK